MLKQLFKIIPKKWLVGGVVLLLLSFLIIYMKKNYIIYTLAGLVFGGALFFTGRCTAPKKIEVVKGVGQIVYQDTCMYSQAIIANVSTQTTTTVQQSTKPGKVVKETSTPAITEVTKKDSVYTTVFKKSYNTGLMKMEFTTTVKANSPATAKIDLEYQIDTIKLKEMTTVINTVVVQEDADNSSKITYLPIEAPSVARYGFQGGLHYIVPQDGLYWSTGLYRQGKSNITVGAEALFEKRNIVGGGINVQVPIFKTK
jgi:hypothetical protein